MHKTYVSNIERQMNKEKKTIPMAQTMNNCRLGWFLLLLHVMGAGIVAKAPPSCISGEGGGRGMVGRGREG